MSERWLSGLPQPVKVAYEAGPTGFGLARFLRGRGLAVWSRRRRSCSGRGVIGSRPMPGTRSCWPGCSSSMRSSRWSCRPWSRKPPGIWSGPVRTSAVI